MIKQEKWDKRFGFLKRCLILYMTYEAHKREREREVPKKMQLKRETYLGINQFKKELNLIFYGGILLRTLIKSFSFSLMMDSNLSWSHHLERQWALKRSPNQTHH